MAGYSEIAPPCLLAEMAKLACLVARPRKCYTPRSAVNISHSTNRSTNQIAGNSLFSSEIILNLFINNLERDIPITSDRYSIIKVKYFYLHDTTEK